MKKRKLKRGFTIAELLITMLVMLVVAVAIIPVLGPKKIKVPRINSNHGLFECYWYHNEDGTDTLMQFSRGVSEDDVPEAQSVPEGQGYCTFNVPKANFFKIEMMSAGGDGYGVGNADTSGNESSSSEGSGSSSAGDDGENSTGSTGTGSTGAGTTAIALGASGLGDADELAALGYKIKGKVDDFSSDNDNYISGSIPTFMEDDTISGKTVPSFYNFMNSSANNTDYTNTSSSYKPIADNQDFTPDSFKYFFDEVGPIPALYFGAIAGSWEDNGGWTKCYSSGGGGGTPTKNQESDLGINGAGTCDHLVSYNPFDFFKDNDTSDLLQDNPNCSSKGKSGGNYVSNWYQKSDGRFILFLTWLYSDKNIGYTRTTSTANARDNSKTKVNTTIYTVTNSKYTNTLSFQRGTSTNNNTDWNTAYNINSLKNALDSYIDNNKYYNFGNYANNASTVTNKFKNFVENNQNNDYITQHKNVFCESCSVANASLEGIVPVGSDVPVLYAGSGDAQFNKGNSLFPTYKIIKPQLTYTYGSKGNDSIVYTKLYPTFGQSLIHVYPARDGSQKTKIVSVKGNKTVTLKEIGNGNTQTKGDAIVFTKKTISNLFSDYVNKIINSTSQSTTLSTGTDNNWKEVFHNISGKNPLQEGFNEWYTSNRTKGVKPTGIGGYGSYLYLDNIEGYTNAQITDTFNQNHNLTPIEENQNRGFRWEFQNPNYDSENDTRSCESGYTLREYNNKYYCVGTKGTPGAVVITW